MERFIFSWIYCPSQRRRFLLALIAISTLICGIIDYFSNSSFLPIIPRIFFGGVGGVFFGFAIFIITLGLLDNQYQNR